MNAEATRLEGKEAAAHAARILVVEDERIVARSLRKELMSFGYDVVGSVPSGEEAVQQAGDLRPELVLMDINLEGPMDGVAAAAAINTRFRIPVVYLTAYSNKEILDRAKITEPFGYILKPYEGRELHVVIETALYKHAMERRQLQAKKMEAIGQLAGGVAHALNNLMTVVLFHSELMLYGMKPGDPFFVSAQAIERSGTRTAALTRKLMAFGRKQTLKLLPVNLNVLVGGLAHVIRHMQAGVQLDLDLEPGLGATMADPEQLEEAIITLVRNACDAMPDGGQIAIRTANVELDHDYIRDHPEMKRGPYVLLAVADTGVGMDENALSHLFEPFYTKEAGVGAGLGLAAVYGFIKQCGGDIEVGSQPAMGTSFRLYLPRVSGRSEVSKPHA